MNLKENEHRGKAMNRNQGKLQEIYENFANLWKPKKLNENLWKSKNMSHSIIGSSGKHWKINAKQCSSMNIMKVRENRWNSWTAIQINENQWKYLEETYKLRKFYENPRMSKTNRWKPMTSDENQRKPTDQFNGWAVDHWKKNCHMISKLIFWRREGPMQKQRNIMFNF